MDENRNNFCSGRNAEIFPPSHNTRPDFLFVGPFLIWQPNLSALYMVLVLALYQVSQSLTQQRNCSETPRLFKPLQSTSERTVSVDIPIIVSVRFRIPVSQSNSAVLGVLAKWRKAIISLVKSVCPFGSMEQLGSYLTDFH